MEFIRGAHNITSRHHGCVASVGNYDGLHPGHRQVIQSLSRKGCEFGLPVTIVSFEPHPLEFFVPHAAPPRLMTVREKLEGLSKLNVDRFLCLTFDHRLANTEPEAFVEDLLVGKLGVRHIVVGDDFRFGRNRRGDFEMLARLGRKFDMEVVRTESFMVGDERVSSSRIRECLASGNLIHANRLLGEDYSLSGRIVRGDGNGRGWGFATANVQIKNSKPALQGIFVVRADLGDGSWLPGVASLGTRPTVDGSKFVLEVHLLDFDKDIYGRRMRVRFLQKLRDEVRFNSIETMCEQIQQDILRTREYFGNEWSQRVS
ncbi:MAG: bifunctional riboflavin kinase/FAD synthetase [Acidiferrobacterales bacterium]|nr:bifunctional riboflavin kinase/FAD synthetase [Acidiferrobacterales bacterium]